MEIRLKIRRVEKVKTATEILQPPFTRTFTHITHTSPILIRRSHRPSFPHILIDAVSSSTFWYAWNTEIINVRPMRQKSMTSWQVWGSINKQSIKGAWFLIASHLVFFKPPPKSSLIFHIQPLTRHRESRIGNLSTDCRYPSVENCCPHPHRRQHQPS